MPGLRPANSLFEKLLRLQPTAVSALCQGPTLFSVHAACSFCSHRHALAAANVAKPAPKIASAITASDL